MTNSYFCTEIIFISRTMPISAKGSANYEPPCRIVMVIITETKLAKIHKDYMNNLSISALECTQLT